MTTEHAFIRPQTGDEYLESLRDGREVWIYGERVADVTTHPAFRNYARSVARLYDALHDPAHQDVLTVPTETGNGSFTHPLFKVPRSHDDLRASRDAIERWQRLGFGWLGRSPDYKGSVTSLLGADPDWFGEYADNAKRWHIAAQEGVLHIGHAIVNPPVDRSKPAESVKDVYVHVVRETDEGLIVSGAKVVATGSPVTQHVYVSHLGAPLKDRSLALTFITPINTPGVKLIARASYEYVAATAASPFDYPLSSRLDENDAILVFDEALIPWENVLIYDTEKVGAFTIESGWGALAILQASTRLGVKLGFIAGLLSKALEVTGTSELRPVQAGLGEVLNAMHTVNGLRDGMIERAEYGGFKGALLPNQDYVYAYAALAPGLYRRVREIIESIVSSGLIYLNSNAVDFAQPELRPYLDQYLRGSGDIPALDRSRIMKALWDSIGSEFGGRHALYELNYFGQPEVHHVTSYQRARGLGTLDDLRGLVDTFFSDYDETGFTAPDLINPGDVNVVPGFSAPRD